MELYCGEYEARRKNIWSEGCVKQFERSVMVADLVALFRGIICHKLKNLAMSAGL